jgi:hypothetical protein
MQVLRALLYLRLTSLRNRVLGLRAQLGHLRLLGGALSDHLAANRIETRDLIVRERERLARPHDRLDTLRGDRMSTREEQSEKHERAGNGAPRSLSH